MVDITKAAKPHEVKSVQLTVKKSNILKLKQFSPGHT